MLVPFRFRAEEVFPKGILTVYGFWLSGLKPCPASARYNTQWNLCARFRLLWLSFGLSTHCGILGTIASVFNLMASVYELAICQTHWLAEPVYTFSCFQLMNVTFSGLYYLSFPKIAFEVNHSVWVLFWVACILNVNNLLPLLLMVIRLRLWFRYPSLWRQDSSSLLKSY